MVLQCRRVFSANFGDSDKTHTPWLGFIKHMANENGKPEYYEVPESMVPISRRALKIECLTYLENKRWNKEREKITVMDNQLMLSCLGLQPYLIKVQGSYDRMLLTCLHLGILHRMITFPEVNDWSRNLLPCPCDDMSNQSLIYPILFFKCYTLPRKRFLIPIFKNLGLRQCRIAYLKLQSLENEMIMAAVSSFLRSVIRSKKTM